MGGGEIKIGKKKGEVWDVGGLNMEKRKVRYGMWGD